MTIQHSGGLPGRALI